MATPDPALWPRVRTVLEALEDDGGASLEALCAGPDGTPDPALVGAVRAALEAERAADAGGFLEGSVVDDAPRLAAGDEPDAVGERVGPWEVTGLLGEGGMGVVYRARRADGAYDQGAALKLVGRGLAPPSLLDRFRRERQILAGLRHPHVARLLDGGLTDRGQPYFAMELVDGEPITDYADRRGLGVEARVRLLRQVVGAVAYAHRRLVVHRDLKPSNVLVAEADGGPRATLLDFGIAKLLDAEAAPGAGGLEAGPRTRTGALLTPEYAAPEQVSGGEVTTATDVYALGVLLYELLAGRRPHGLEGLTPSGVERALEAVPPPPSSVAGAKLGDLDAVCLKALAPEPDRRYASADALGDDLDRVLAGLPVEARAPTARYRASRFVKRHPAGVAAAAAFVVLLVGFGVVSSLQARRLATESAKARAVSAFVLGLFEASDPGRARGVEATAGELLARGAERAQAMDGPPEVRAELLRTLGEVHLKLGAFEEARPLLEGAGALAREYGGPDGLATALNLLAGLEARVRRLDAAEALAREALALEGVHDTLRYQPHLMLGMLALRTQDYDAVESHTERARVLARAIRPGHRGELAALNNLAQLYHRREEWDRYDAALEETLALRHAAQGADHPGTASARYNLGRRLCDRGDVAAGLDTLRAALAVQRRVLPTPHHNTINTLRALGRRLPAAEGAPLLREALAQLEAGYPEREGAIAEVLAELEAAEAGG